MSVPDDAKRFLDNFLEVSDVKLLDQLMETMSTASEEGGGNLRSSVDHPSENVEILTPQPGFCVKIRGEPPAQKIFINVCKSTGIPAPRDISQDELISIIESSESSSYRVPMSLGEAHAETDKSGAPCFAYDVTINVDFYRKVKECDLFKTFLISVSMEGLEDKHNIELNKNNWIILKNCTYLGTLSNITVQKRRKPLITEIEKHADAKNPEQQRVSSRLKQKTDNAMAKRRPLKVSVPHLTLHALPPHLSTRALLAEIKLPKVDYSDVVLHVGADRLQLEAITYDKSNKYVMDIFIPIIILPDETRAQFDTRSEVLLVDMPYAVDEH